jgi:hypothetical protein
VVGQHFKEAKNQHAGNQGPQAQGSHTILFCGLQRPLDAVGDGTSGRGVAQKDFGGVHQAGFDVHAFLLKTAPEQAPMNKQKKRPQMGSATH